MLAIEPRLFVDFQADSCVIIKDTKQFQNLLKFQNASYFPETNCRHGNAVYIDPLLPTTPNIDVSMSKHFRYTYQQEYRFVWHPIVAKTNLPYLDLEIGSLKDIAELITL